MTESQDIKKKGFIPLLAGFTLVELMVVISIIIILSLIMIPNYRSFQRDLALQRMATKLAQDIRRTQGMAMTAQECTHDNCTGGGDPIIPEGGYGVYFTESTNEKFIIYADMESPWEKRDPEGDEDIDNIFLEPEVYISRVGTSASKVNINFKPPDPEITMKWDATGEADSVEIDISLKNDPTKTKTITVNKAGLITVE